jgi:hypothetical protein
MKTLTLEHYLKKNYQGRIDNIQSGAGLNRSNFPDDAIGEIAKEQWNDVKFAYGMEYGYLLAMYDLLNGLDSTEATPPVSGKD